MPRSGTTADGRNASRTEPAKFLVLLLKSEGVEPVLPVQ
jgi:hypothetical protein